MRRNFRKGGNTSAEKENWCSARAARSKAYATAERWRILEPLRKAVNLQRGEARRREVLPVRNRVSARIAYEHMTLSGRGFLWLIAASGAGGYVHLGIGAAAKQA